MYWVQWYVHAATQCVNSDGQKCKKPHSTDPWFHFTFYQCESQIPNIIILFYFVYNCWWLLKFYVLFELFYCWSSWNSGHWPVSFCQYVHIEVFELFNFVGTFHPICDDVRIYGWLGYHLGFPKGHGIVSIEKLYLYGLRLDRPLFMDHFSSMCLYLYIILNRPFIFIMFKLNW